MPSQAAHHYGLEQARTQLPHIATNAKAGVSSVITRRGQPVAAVVPIEIWQAQQKTRVGLMPLRGSGKGLWGKDIGQTIDALRNEW